MRRLPFKACSLVVSAACVLVASASVARAQSIEPRAYSNAPVGVNFLLAGPYYTRGGLSFDTSLPVTDPQPKTSNAVLGYARALDLWGRESSTSSCRTPGCRERRPTKATRPTDEAH